MLKYFYNSSLLSVIGLIFILAPALFQFSPFIPTIGAFLILLTENSSVNKAFFSNYISVFIGKLSYPIYLWHYPLLSFFVIISGNMPSFFIRINLILLTFFLAYLTYFFIEKPLLSNKFIGTKVSILLLSIIICAYVSHKIYVLNGLPLRDSIYKISMTLKEKVKPVKTRWSDGSCEKLLGFKIGSNDVVCLVNSLTPKVMIIGDSHAMALNSSIYLKDFNLDSLLISAHGCLPLYGFVILDNGVQQKKCDALSENIFLALSQYKSIEIILIATRGPFYFTGKGYGIEGANLISIKEEDSKKILSQPEMFKLNYQNFILAIQKFKKRIIFIIDVPELGQDPAGCIISRPLQFNKNFLSNCTNKIEDVLERQHSYRNIVFDLKNNIPSIEVYDPLNIFCDNKNCYGIRDGHLMYFDDDHITPYASMAILNNMRELKLFEKSN